ncbi:hypothetical protein QYG89_15220 [Bacillus sp. B190/17]|uniref:Uncharacterized protein n=1 Tax=Bacillus lumedeiriae TaxID=3058829 RepID=A0ABW8IC03_9BACI
MALLFLLAGTLFLGLYVRQKRQSSNYKIDRGMLIVNNRFNEVNIPLTEIVGVAKIGKTTKRSSGLKREILLGRHEYVAVFTRSNVSYLLKVRNAKTLIRGWKEQNPQMHKKAKVI